MDRRAWNVGPEAPRELTHRIVTAGFRVLPA